MKKAAAFDISSPEVFFSLIKREFQNFNSRKGKNTAQLFFIVMGLNHLREWIAIDYAPYRNRETIKPKNDAEKFSKKVYDSEDGKLVRELCNHTKHIRGIKCNTGAPVQIDEWGDLDSVLDFDIGEVQEYFAQDINVADVITRLIRLYEEEWFNSPQSSSPIQSE